MVRINLLPVKVSKKRVAGKQHLVLFAAVLVLGIVGNFIVASARGSVLSSKQAKIAQTKDQISRLDKVIGEVAKYKEAKKELEAKLAILDKLKAGRTGPVRMLDALASITPKRLWLKKMDEKGGNISFDGAAATIDDVSAFMKELKRSQYFGGAELKKTTAREEKGYKLVEFQLNAPAKYNPLAVAEAEAAAKSGKAPAAAPKAR
jgi:type IV pilus assembly protein PilN